MIVAFVIPGRIGGKQRAGRKRLPGGAVLSFNPKQTANQEHLVRSYAAEKMRGQPVMTGPVRLHIEMMRVPPASWSKKKQKAACWVTGKPDCDNTLKLVGDALNGVVWRDDAQIADLAMQRRYGDHEQVSVLIEDL